MTKPWTIQDAKARLSEVLRLARAGEPQRIGMADACIVISEKDWGAREPKHLGQWLVQTAPRGEPLVLPSRKPDRGDPFADSKE